MDQLTGLRSAVAAAARELAAAGMFVGSAGNLSARQGDLVALTATGAVLAQATADHVTVVDLDGRMVAGELAPTSEAALHLGVYRQSRSEPVGGVVHTHSRMATALATVLDEVPVVHYQQLVLGGTLRVAPFHPFGSADLARAVMAALEDRSAALMANHGQVALGRDLAQAVANAQLTEWLCELYWTARAIGRPRPLTPADQLAVIEAAAAMGYGSTRRAA
ncbi:MAG: class II aldolase/adducin family protein [Bifidobacteriaceae bacterium]|jgi:L-fuculose-phosphate aldolase|nr:class II aldolase/adducin family protein [Bifidobacteriaceae bacterium]